jgi:hypothetical protein
MTRNGYGLDRFRLAAANRPFDYAACLCVPSGGAWHVDDVEDAPPAEALKLLAQQVITLLQQFRAAIV